MEMTYKTHGDYQFPNLTLEDKQRAPLGKYGRMRRSYLQKHRPVLFSQLLMSGKLWEHLTEIDQVATSRLEQMMEELPKAQGVTEALKASDPMRWTGLMNNLKAQAEEALLTELIYS